MGYHFDWSIASRYANLFRAGLIVTIELSLVSILLATIFGTLLGVGRLSKRGWVRGLVGAYVEFFLNTPLVVQLFFWYFGLPMLLPDGVKNWLWAHNFEFIAGVIGLTVYTSTFIAETVRAGIQAIDAGQTEAALSQGFTPRQAMWHIILPQAFQVILPPLGSQFLNLVKNSSLAMTIAVQELTFQSQAVEAQTFRGFEATTIATLAYIALTLTITGLVYLVQYRISRHLRVARNPQVKLSALDRDFSVTEVG